MRIISMDFNYLIKYLIYIFKQCLSIPTYLELYYDDGKLGWMMTII